MARKPVVNQDGDAWGTILNEYLDMSHNLDGTLKDTAINLGATTINAAIDATETVANRADSRVFDVRAYGAVGNGVADDTGAIQAAIDAAYATGLGGTVFFPQGIYIATGLVLKYRVSLLGAFSQQFNEGASDHFGSVLKLKASSTQPLITSDQVNGLVRGTSAIGGGSQRYQNSTIEGIGLHGNRANQVNLNADLIRLQHVWNVVIKNCYLVDAKGFGIRALDCNTLTIRHNSMIYAPVYLESLADSLIEGNQMGGGNSIVGPVLWLTDGGQNCWANIFATNFIFNNVSPPSYVATADPATDVLTTAVQGFVDAFPVIVRTTGTLPGGITAGTTYYLKVLSSTSVKLATTRANLAAGTYVDITSAGSGTHILQAGEHCNLYLSGTLTKWNTFSANRFDQAHGHNVVCDGARENEFANNQNIGAGLGNATGQAGYRLQNGATGNSIGGGITDGLVYSSGGAATKQIYGIWADATSTGTRIRPTTHIRNHSSGNIVIPDMGEAEFLTLTSADFEAMNGTPVIGLIALGRRNAWLMDAATNETIGTEFSVPRDWGSIIVKLRWVNGGPGTGDVQWALNMGENAVGATLNVADSFNPAVTVTAGAQDVLMETAFVAMTVTPGRSIFVRVIRVASDAADTLPNDVGIVAVRVERVG